MSSPDRCYRRRTYRSRSSSSVYRYDQNQRWKSRSRSRDRSRSQDRYYYSDKSNSKRIRRSRSRSSRRKRRHRHKNRKHERSESRSRSPVYAETMTNATTVDVCAIVQMSGDVIPWKDSWDIEVESPQHSPTDEIVEISSDESANKRQERKEFEATNSYQIDNFIDNDIVQKVITNFDRAGELASTLQFDFDKTLRQPSISRPNFTVTPRSSVSLPVNLPIPSTKFLPDNNDVRYRQPTTYGEYKKLKAKEVSLRKTNINDTMHLNQMERNKVCEATSSVEPSQFVENTNTQFDNHHITNVDISQPSTSAGSYESTEIGKLGNSSENKSLMDHPVKNPSNEDEMIAKLRECISTDQLATLFNLLKKLATSDLPTKLHEAPNNNTNECFASEEREERDSDGLSPSESNDPVTIASRPTSSRRDKLLKNNNLEWNSLTKVLNCQACCKPHGNSLVSHYVNEHPDKEVLVSRLPPAAADSLRSGKGIVKCKIVRQQGSANYEFQQFCYFCNIYKCFTRSLWITHLSRHTGYYQFKCNDCSRQFAQEPIKGRCHDINDFSTIKQERFAQKNSEVKAYVCDRCNYLRCRRHEIELHVNNEHDDDSITYSCFSLLTFPRRKLNTKTYVGTDYESDTPSEYESDVDVGFEPTELRDDNEDYDATMWVPVTNVEDMMTKEEDSESMEDDADDPDYVP